MPGEMLVSRGSAGLDGTVGAVLTGLDACVLQMSRAAHIVKHILTICALPHADSERHSPDLRSSGPYNVMCIQCAPIHGQPSEQVLKDIPLCTIDPMRLAQERPRAFPAAAKLDPALRPPAKG